MQDSWYKLYNHRLDWMKDAQKIFLESFHDKHVRTLYDLPSWKEIFVAVYGPSQVGKTTLILTLLGLKEEAMHKVSEALRGGRLKGESATVTTTTYYKSADNRYEVRQEKGLITYIEDENHLVRFMARLRQKVEISESFSMEPIEIGIPNNYFAVGNNQLLSIKIVDLPGVNSSSPEEREHVKKVVQYFVPRANIVLLVNLAYRLTKFERFNHYLLDNWMDTPEKYRIVITRSVSGNSIRKKFATGENINKEDFLSYFYSEFKETIPTFPERVGIYPVEFGESWGKLKEDDPKLRRNAEPIIQKLLEDLIKDINNSANEFSGIRINYRIYNTVKKRIQEKESYFLKKGEQLKERISYLEKKIELVKKIKISFLSRLNDKLKARAILEVEKSFRSSIDVLSMDREDAKSVQYLRKFIELAEVEIYKQYEQQRDEYEMSIEEILKTLDGYYQPYSFQLNCNKLKKITESIKLRLNGYWTDSYWGPGMVSKWERDREEAKMRIQELALSVQLSLEKDFAVALNGLGANIEEEISDYRIKIIRSENLLKKLTSNKEMKLKLFLQHHIDFQKFNQNSKRDLDLAKSFQQYVNSSFQGEYKRTLEGIKSSNLNSISKFYKLCYLQLTLKNYELLVEEK
jgi:GTP-binding protein EngB required for normal cell division